ncbi:hypothetical protein ULMS_00630 [Patiriisocius marinistellae]|uniref:Heme oxygenase n=1 Tax=Patiriisocius marinistellae TaxID=2494560 RepID=A0A5J4FWY4_9FLAO|nr:DUF3050 domain-containing protein [Patiriisocius marinistellae]GEQ84555.1 hypothetical protein ULMS_00630 [Patiriisocius marinistellae]
MISDIISAIKAHQNKLLNHPLYTLINTPKDLQIFMEHHVFAVWDFMSLLKALQSNLTCTSIPWVPVGNPNTRYLINEIVLAEETDLNQLGERQSHFEMYLDAMKKAGAKTSNVNELMDSITLGTEVFEAIENLEVQQSIKDFLRFTFSTIKEGKPHSIAAAFTFGREDLIPQLFTSIINEIQQHFPEKDLIDFKYYFDRHIELDGDEHGPMALKMIDELCGKDEIKWKEVEEISIAALNARILLWDGIEAAIKEQTTTIID